MYRPFRLLAPLGSLLVLSTAGTASLDAQAAGLSESVTVIPGAHYRASGLHRFFFGTRYRALWTTPIRVPVLDLRQFGGGLRPTRRGGGQQTKSLRFSGGDGREYQFRSVDKDPTLVLPVELRNTFARDLMQDQISSAHPAGPLIVPPLLEAAGVLHTRPVLVQMPDDPALDSFRADFAGVLGMIEERPRELAEGPTIGGATTVEDTEDLYKRLDENPPVRVDARSFLRARLTDIFIGDWDRHADQWRWALVDTGGPRRWLPIPRDRDQAFVRFDGFLLSIARQVAPQLTHFKPDYPNIVGATWNGRELDRRFLAPLERPAWDSITRDLGSRWTDQVIHRAEEQLPPEFRPLDGPRLEATLRARRDNLPELADRYYRLLADQVELYGTDRDDSAHVTREAGGATVVSLRAAGTEYFRRRFDPDETREIRLHLLGGADRFSIEGPGGGPRFRVLGGGGNDQFVVRSGRVHLYDDRGENHSEGEGINRRRWSWQPDSTRPNELPPRDWGKRTFLLASASYGYDVQAILGYGGWTDWYGFRRIPYSTRLSYRLEFATGKLHGRATVGVTRMFENSRAYYQLETKASGIEVLRWYGFGNETVQDDDVAFHRVSQNELSAALRFGVRIGERGQFSLGPLVRWSYTDVSGGSNADRFIGQDQPFGVGRFGLVGGQLTLVLDGRDEPHFPSRGAMLSVQGTAYPELWDAVESIARVEAQGSLALSPGGSWRPTLSLMAGGVKTFGQVPFFVAPTLGGTRTLRGYRPDRFAGEASAYGSAELRLPLTRIRFVLPGEQGLFGFVDGGRVWVEGESSDEWHSSFGGGVWFAFLTRANVLYVGAGAPTRGDEGMRLIIGFGFPY